MTGQADCCYCNGCDCQAGTECSTDCDCDNCKEELEK